ncbi:MAG: alpha-L-fucosidase [Opitutales bacterium]
MSAFIVSAMCLAISAPTATFGAEPGAQTEAETDWQALEARREAKTAERLEWWDDAKFGMFVHWGVYAVIGAELERHGGYAEWTMHGRKMPVAEYREVAKRFNPVNYDPEAWAELVEDAGMKYLIITSKHHDGFALFDSEVTDWDIVDATPYGKGLLKPLADALHKRELRFGTYYSQAQDWTHPGGGIKGYEEGDGWDEAQKGSMDDYLAEIAVPQVKEIVRDLDPDVIWWDTPENMRGDRADPFKRILLENPKIISNSRLGGGFADTHTPEQNVPSWDSAQMTDYWETCMTMNRTWGYSAADDVWKDTPEMIQVLIDVVSKGGNLLLNVGPKPDGTIPEESVRVLREMGDWMDVYGDAIYGTEGSPFGNLPWGRATRKETDEGTRLYLHVWYWPEDGKLLVPDLQNDVRATLMASGEELKTERQGEDVSVQVPAEAPHPVASVIELQVEGELEAQRLLPSPENGVIHLGAVIADIHNSGHAPRIRREIQDGKVHLDDWTAGGLVRVHWAFDPRETGAYRLSAEVASEKESKGHVIIGPRDPSRSWGLKVKGEEQPVAFPATGGLENFQTVEIGTVEIEEIGGEDAPTFFQLYPGGKEWNQVNIRSLMLEKVN